MRTESKSESELLEEIHSAVTSDVTVPDEIRWSPNQDEVAGQIIRALSTGEELSASEISNRIETDSDITRALINMYRSYLLDRDTRGKNTYTLSEYGVKVAEGFNEQTELNPEPWESADISRAEYVTLELIHGYDGHPKSGDINQSYLDSTNADVKDTTSYAVCPRLSQLYDDGYIDRPAQQPYRYWLTEKGESVLNE